MWMCRCVCVFSRLCHYDLTVFSSGNWRMCCQRTWSLNLSIVVESFQKHVSLSVVFVLLWEGGWGRGRLGGREREWEVDSQTHTHTNCCSGFGEHLLPSASLSGWERDLPETVLSDKTGLFFLFFKCVWLYLLRWVTFFYWTYCSVLNVVKIRKHCWNNHTDSFSVKLKRTILSALCLIIDSQCSELRLLKLVRCMIHWKAVTYMLRKKNSWVKLSFLLPFSFPLFLFLSFLSSPFWCICEYLG